MSKHQQLRQCADYVNEKVKSENLALSEYVTTDNLLQNKKGKVDVSSLPAQTANVTKYAVGDILLANIRPYLKKIWYANKAGGCSADVLVFRARRNVDSRFLFYAMFRDDFFDHVMKGSKGTKMPRGDRNQIMAFIVPSFDLVRQKKIAEILSSLDAKIELNNRINAELEAMAKTLYDYWFVQFDFPFDFAQGKPDANGKPYKSSGGKMIYNPTLKREIPEGWKVKKLEQIATVVRGASPRPIDDYLSDRGLPWIKISDATASENRFILKTKQFIKEEGKSATRVLSSNKLILSNSATPGIPRITKIESGIHDGWLYIDDFKHGFSMEILYQFFLNERPRILNLGNGSIFKNLKTDYIKSISLVSPPEIVLKKASAVLTKISDLLYTSSRETKELEELRDWLLPMLMNGQVTVKR